MMRSHRLLARVIAKTKSLKAGADREPPYQGRILILSLAGLVLLSSYLIDPSLHFLNCKMQ